MTSRKWHSHIEGYDFLFSRILQFLITYRWIIVKSKEEEVDCLCFCYIENQSTSVRPLLLFLLSQFWILNSIIIWLIFFCFMFGVFRLAFENFLKFLACRKFGVLRLTFENFLTTSLRKLILITVQDHLVVRMLG